MDDETRFLLTSKGTPGRLRALEDSGILGHARDLDGQLAQRVPSQSLLFWQATSTHASAVGYRLAAFDRESRRATRMLVTAEPRLPRPLPMSQGGFAIDDASPGSLELILVGLGVTAQVLLSQPVQLVLTARALVGDVRRVASWIGRRLPTAPRPSLPDVRSTVEAVLRERGDTQVDTPPQISWNEHGPVIRGAVDATIVRLYPDGSVDLVRFEGAGPRS
jgi:hypothetical protein